MSVSKRIINLVLGLLLFLCLLALGPVVTLKVTLLNTAFVTNRLNDLDMTALIRDELPIANLPSSLPDNFEEVLLNHADEIKQTTIQTVAESHRYLVNGESFNLAATIRTNLSRQELGASIIADLDFKSTAQEIIQTIVPPILSSYNTSPYLETAVPVMEKWLKAQLEELLPAVYDYLLYPNPPLTVANVPLSDITQEVRLAIKESFLRSPPSEIADMPPVLLAAAFDLGWNSIQSDVPESLAIDFSKAFGSPGGTARVLNETQKVLNEAQLWAKRCQTGFLVLAVTTAVLTIVIAIINRGCAASYFILGLASACAGLISLFGSLLGQNAIRTLLTGNDFRFALETWILHLTGDIFRPLLIFAAVCVLVGATLLATDYFVRQRLNMKADSKHP